MLLIIIPKALGYSRASTIQGTTRGDSIRGRDGKLMSMATSTMTIFGFGEEDADMQ